MAVARLTEEISMSMRGQGLLAIWSDIEPARQTDYLHWLTREHMRERIGVDGFLGGRVFRCAERDRCRFFIVYELEDSSALVGPSYLARLNAPTPWSQRTMPILQNFVRGGGSVAARAGLGAGGVVAPLRFSYTDAPGLSSASAQQRLVDRAADLDGISAAWLMDVDEQATIVQTREKTMRRSTEGSFNALLCIEGLHDAAVQAAVEAVIAQEFANVPVVEFTRFAVCFSLDRRTAGIARSG
jgi:hypothetical protein